MGLAWFNHKKRALHNNKCTGWGQIDNFEKLESRINLGLWQLKG